MKIFDWGRGTGKTRHLIEVSHCRNIPILVHSVAMQKYICEMAQDLGLEIPMPIAVTTLKKDRKQNIVVPNQSFLVDEYILVLKALLAQKGLCGDIVEMTTTSEEYE